MKFKDKTLLITGGTGSFGNAVLNRFLHTDHFKETSVYRGPLLEYGPSTTLVPRQNSQHRHCNPQGMNNNVDHLDSRAEPLGRTFAKKTVVSGTVALSRRSTHKDHVKSASVYKGFRLEQRPSSTMVPGQNPPLHKG